MTSDISVVKKLQTYLKSFFSVADLSKILNLSESEIYVTLTRLTQRGVLIRLTKGYYSVFGKSIDTDIIATQIYHPSYVSLETILARSGVIDQIPLELTMVTTNKSQQSTIIQQCVSYRQIKHKLFFGYYEQNSGSFAYPEKALLDKLYYSYRGHGVGVDFKELDVSKFNGERWRDYSKQFPQGMQSLITKIPIG